MALLAARGLAQDELPDDDGREEEVDDVPAAWTMALLGEAGIGMRDVELPRDGLLSRVNTGIFPALGLGVALDFHASKRASLGLVARYQTSIGLVLTEQLTDGTQHERKTRSHHFEVGLAPTLRFGDGGWALYGALGYAVSELDPENHLVTPSYHLAGPYLRVGLQLPLGSERLRLRLGPDGQLVVQVGDELLALHTDARGLGAGASASLEFSLGERWTLAVSFREQRFWLGTQQAQRFTDAARFVTAQLRGML